MSLAPDPSKHDDSFINRVYESGIASSTCVSVGGPFSSGLSMMKSAKTWLRMDVLDLTLTASLAAQRYIIGSSLGFCAVTIGGNPSRIFKRCSAMNLGMPVMSVGFQSNTSKLSLNIGGGALNFTISMARISFGIFIRATSPRLKAVVVFIMSFMDLGMSCMNQEILMHSGAPLTCMLSALNHSMTAFGDRFLLFECVVCGLPVSRVPLSFDFSLVLIKRCGVALGPRRECTSLRRSPSRVKTFLSLSPSLVNTVALSGLLGRVSLDSSRTCSNFAKRRVINRVKNEAKGWIKRNHALATRTPGVRPIFDTYDKAVSFIGKLMASFRVPSNHKDRNVTYLQLFDFTIHYLHWFFNKVELIINTELIQGNHE
uniref:Uncharacterized protein n=1 Tax=Tanacetum cinerariifolium TaxID=118510 RepID=A0A6L2JR85_TANCI|nr:hypothetical protein [Tanacetum cinerariifolium]